MTSALVAERLLRVGRGVDTLHSQRRVSLLREVSLLRAQITEECLEG